MGGDHHRRVDDDREARQRESISRRRPLFSKQKRHEGRRGTRKRREQHSGEDYCGGQQPRQHAAWIPAGGPGPRHRWKGHAQQREQERLGRLERSQDEARKKLRQLGITAKRVEINGQPGAMFVDPDGRLTNVFALDIADGRIQTVRSVINPEKLHHLGPLADMVGLRRQLHQRD